MTETLISMAYSNYAAAENLFNAKVDDERFINFTGYFLQQATELALKHVLECLGIRYSKVHDIGEILKELPNTYDSKFVDIRTYKDTITKWESKTRYIKNYYLELNEVLTIKPLIKNFLDEVEKMFSGDIDIPENLKEQIWAAIPEITRKLYGTTKEEIITNFYIKHKSLFEDENGL